jgi:hypothetical protein
LQGLGQGTIIEAGRGLVVTDLYEKLALAVVSRGNHWRTATGIKHPKLVRGMFYVPV